MQAASPVVVDSVPSGQSIGFAAPVGQYWPIGHRTTPVPTTFGVDAPPVQ